MESKFIDKFYLKVVLREEWVVLGYHAGYCEVADARAVGGIEVVVLLVEAR